MRWILDVQRDVLGTVTAETKSLGDDNLAGRVCMELLDHPETLMMVTLRRDLTQSDRQSGGV